MTGPSRNGALVAAHLDELAQALPGYKKVHVILDSAKIHKCAAVDKVLKKHGGRIVLHFLPLYAPECNPIERVWWHLRGEITRCHQCRTLDELLGLVFACLAGRQEAVPGRWFRLPSEERARQSERRLTTFASVWSYLGSSESERLAGAGASTPNPWPRSVRPQRANAPSSSANQPSRGSKTSPLPDRSIPTPPRSARYSSISIFSRASTTRGKCFWHSSSKRSRNSSLWSGSWWVPDGRRRQAKP